FRPDHRMQNRLEAIPRPGVAEREFAHGGAVERAASRDRLIAERAAARRDRLARGPRELVRDLVGVHHVHAEPREQRRDRALAAADAARESDRVGLHMNCGKNWRVSCGPQNRAMMPAMARYAAK